jgi:Bacteriophage replication protein O
LSRFAKLVNAQELRKAPIQETPPAPQTAPIPEIAPAPETAPVPNTPQPLFRTPPVSQTAPVRQAPAGHTRITHQVSDEIMPTLDVYAQSILQRLLRLSWGWSHDTCKVGLPRLCQMTNISESKARKALRLLAARGLIEVVEQDLSNVNQAERGTVYRILIAPVSRTAPSQKTAPARETAPVPETPNKVNTQKENTQTQEGVRVGSKFSIEDCRRYADHLRSTGQGINNPGGYATTIHRTGEADALIGAFLNSAPEQPHLAASQCPDCQGSGFYYPSGPSGGVAKCKHDKLVSDK